MRSEVLSKGFATGCLWRKAAVHGHVRSGGPSGPLMTHSRHCFRDAREYYRSGFDFHSTASFCASAICAGVICCATRFRLLIASWSLRAAAKLSHMYA